MSMDNGTGWERHRKTHFDEIVSGYDLARPDYPAPMFEDILQFSAKNDDRKALEIGAGTGKATAPFLSAGYNVTAVEIGANMAEFLLNRFVDYKCFRVIVSTFEDVLLEEKSFDLVYAASSFHWVDAEIGCPKVFRLLKNGGTFALLRYNFNFIPPHWGNALHEDISAAYNKHYYTYYTSKDKSYINKITKKGLEDNPKILHGYGFQDMSTYGFSGIKMKLYETVITYSADAWISMLDTLSDHRNLPDANREALYAEVKDAILSNNGEYKVDFVFQLYMGRK